MIGFRKTEFATKIIDLTKEISTLQATLDKTAAYEIRRAQRDGARFMECNNIDVFIAFHNQFAEQKKMPMIAKQHIAPLMQFLRIVEARHGDATLVMHAYLLDRDSMRCRLLHSSSHFRNDPLNLAMKAQTGRANRFLHWASMLHFKEAGFRTYDLGGYALNTSDSQLQGINQFKDSFGGELLIEHNYTSWLMDLGQRLSHLIRRGAQ